MRERPVRERIMIELRREIAAGRRAAGGWLESEPELAARFGASRTAVRAALGELVDHGELERVPHRGWRIPRSRRFERVLFVRHHRGGPSDRDLEAGLRSVLAPAGIDLEVAAVPDGQPRHRWGEIELQDRAVRCGAVVAFTEYGLPAAWSVALARAGVSVVCLGCNLHLSYDTVCADFAAMSRQLVQAVHRRGHRAIAFVGHAHLHRNNPAFKARVDGYDAAMRELGLQPAVAYLGDRVEHPRELEEAFAAWFDRLAVPPTCLYVSGNRFVARIASILQRIGYRVPEDISMAGFGVSPEVLHGEHALFTRFLHVPEPWRAIGAAAGARLAAAAGCELPPALTLVPSRLVTGDSVRHR